MPFTDYRSQRILNNKIRQLSREKLGLIVMGLSGIPGGFKHWPELIRRRLQPNLNRRIGGVLLTESAITGKSMENRKVLIEHPNPFRTLPQEFVKIMVSSE